MKDGLSFITFGSFFTQALLRSLTNASFSEGVEGQLPAAANLAMALSSVKMLLFGKIRYY